MNELLMMVDVLAREKNLARDTVFTALEAALASAKRKNIHAEADVRVSIDRSSGSYVAYRRWTVVEDDLIESEAREIALSVAKEDSEEVELEDVLEEELPAVEVLGRVEAAAARQVIMQKVREAERAQLLADFLERGDKLVSGTIRRMDRGNAIVEIGRLEAVLPKENMIPRENLRIGDRIKACVSHTDSEARGPQVFLSRSNNELVSYLFALEVPEIEEGLIEIMGAVRDPGQRAKVAVRATTSRIDPVGTCIGLRGARVQAIMREINGERLDIVPWSAEDPQFVIDALSPADVQGVVVDEETQTMDIVVANDNLAIAIGRGGQNVRLASELTGWQVNLMTKEESEKRIDAELAEARLLFMEQLGVDEELSDILATEGFRTLEEIAYIPLSEMMEIDALDEELSTELRERARDALLTAAIMTEEKIEAIDKDFMSLDGMDRDLAIKLIENGINDRDQLADLATDELVDLIDIEEEQASNLIMNARAHWFQ